VAKQHAVQIFKSAIAAVQPVQLMQDTLGQNNDSLFIGDSTIPKSSVNHIYVIGAGKASAAMAIETEKILGDYISDGMVTTKYNHALPSKKIKFIEAAHPVPDENSVMAVSKTLELLKQAGKNDIVICLLSGGASALWCDVPNGLTLHDAQTTFDLLIRSGAAIDEINTVRKHLSNMKGGQLINHCGGATVFSFIISDVPFDNIDAIGSGPTVPDSSTFADTLCVLSKYDLLSSLPESVLLHIEKGINGKIAETPKPGNSLFYNSFNKIIGNNRMAVLAAADAARALGYETKIIDDLITGEVESEAKELITLAKTYQGKKPVCILQGGETTVKVTGKGKGGRNQHFVLAALHELSKMRDEDFINSITVLSGGTDGTDGPTDATGAVANGESLKKAFDKNLSVETFLKNHDSYHFHEQTNGLLITGPTQTNVMDIMMAIVA
jgi:glycerate 2-kinase